MDCSVLITSCDKYKDLKVPFLNLFRKYWPDCPFPVYWYSSSNELSWGEALKNQFEYMKTPYVLKMCEDFFLQSPVDTSMVTICLNALHFQDGNYLRLTPRPKPDRKVWGRSYIGEIDKGAPYRAGLQAAIWRRSTFLYLLEDEPTWSFEFTASRKSDTLDGFYSTYKPILDYPLDVVVKGKWMRYAAKRYGRMNIGCDFTKRPIMTRREALLHYYTKYSSKIQHIIPWRYRRWIRSRL